MQLVLKLVAQACGNDEVAATTHRRIVRPAAAPQATAPVTLVPPAGLVVANPQRDKAPPLFYLFTEDWLILQAFVVQALQLPITTGDFESKYGKFSDEQDIKSCVAAMSAVKALITTFGDPRELIKALAADPTILQGDTPADVNLCPHRVVRDQALPGGHHVQPDARPVHADAQPGGVRHPRAVRRDPQGSADRPGWIAVHGGGHGHAGQ